jgi:hypothetical protein
MYFCYDNSMDRPTKNLYCRRCNILVSSFKWLDHLESEPHNKIKLVIKYTYYKKKKIN